MSISKQDVRAFWNQASCGEDLYLDSPDAAGYAAHAAVRYQLEPYIAEFANFNAAQGARVLEIGVGLGADHQRFAESGALLVGIDLTERAVQHTQHRLAILKLHSSVTVGDAENLPFEDKSFDIVYSWGVLHHSPDTRRAISEVRRVLKPDSGVARIMIYHKWSFVGFMLWTRYALLRGRPFLSLDDIYAQYLESPGTKAYSVSEARDLFSGFRDVRIRTLLSHADLLESAAGQRHRGAFLSVARRIWPRALVRRLFPQHGLVMLIEARA